MKTTRYAQRSRRTPSRVSSRDGYRGAASAARSGTLLKKKTAGNALFVGVKNDTPDLWELHPSHERDAKTHVATLIRWQGCMAHNVNNYYILHFPTSPF